jgi:hypothetical protein
MIGGVLLLVAEERGAGNVSREGGFGPWAGFQPRAKNCPRGLFSLFLFLSLFFFVFF